MSSPTVGPPPIIPHQSELDTIVNMINSAGNGYTADMLAFSLSLTLGWSGYDIRILTEQGEYYGPLESNADALNNLLQTHKEHVVEINDTMKRYLDRAVEVMQTRPTGVPDNIRDTINRLKNGESVSEEQAKALFSWSNEAKEYVIPSGFRTSVLANQLEHSENRYQATIQEYTQFLGQLFPV